MGMQPPWVSGGSNGEFTTSRFFAYLKKYYLTAMNGCDCVNVIQTLHDNPEGFKNTLEH